MSKIIASLIIALAGLIGANVSDHSAVELAGVVLQVGGILTAWVLRARKPDVHGVLGIKQR